MGSGFRRDDSLKGEEHARRRHPHHRNRSWLSRRPGLDGRRLGHPRRNLREEGDPGRARRHQDRDRQGRRRPERRRDRPRRRALCLQQRRRGLRDDAEISVDRAGAGLQERLDPAHRHQDRRNQNALHRVQRPQIVGPERHRVRQAGRVLFHRSRQALSRITATMAGCITRCRTARRSSSWPIRC